MPRIAIDDTLFIDPRFDLLCQLIGSKAKAIGVLVMAWQLAQKFYRNGSERIPTSVWACLDSSELILKSNLADINDAGVRMAGIKEQFAWLDQKRAAGKRSAEIKRELVQRASTESNGAQPLPIPNSIPIPIPNKKEEKKKLYDQNGHILHKVERRKPPLISFADKFTQIYSEFPRRVGKAKGVKTLERLARESKEPDALLERILRATRNYSELCRIENTDEKFMKHFSSFVNVWSDYENLDDLSPQRAQSLIIKEKEKEIEAERIRLQEYLK